MNSCLFFSFSCRKCRKDFCWICMQDWSLHSDVTGGYFQCNRYLQSTRAADKTTEDEAWDDSRGNAHVETLRLKEKKKKMARFIHHFTRYTTRQLHTAHLPTCHTTRQLHTAHLPTCHTTRQLHTAHLPTCHNAFISSQIPST
jgi:hypothetical protein